MQHEFNVFQCDLMQWWCTTIEFENLLQIQAWFFRSKRLEFILKFVKYVIKQQYSREQKQVLLSIKSDFLIFKFSNSNMPQIFLGTKLFCLLSEWAKKRYLTNAWCVCQVHIFFFQLIRTTFIFWPHMLLIEFNSISNMGCH